jgi:hypothetical protein
MKGHGFVGLVDHRQANAPGLRLVQQFAVFFPAVQGRQGVEFPLDGPVGANYGIGRPTSQMRMTCCNKSARRKRSGRFRRVQAALCARPF